MRAPEMHNDEVSCMSLKRSTRRSCNREKFQRVPVCALNVSAYLQRVRVPRAGEDEGEDRAFQAALSVLAARTVCKRQTERRPEGSGDISE